MKIIRRLLKFLTSRLFFFGLSILLQFALIFLMILHISNYGYFFYTFMAILSMITVLFIVAKKDNPMYKLAWVIPIAFFPIFGWFIYFIGGRAKVSKRHSKHLTTLLNQSVALLIQDENITNEIETTDKSFSKSISYLNKTSHFPIYKNTTVQYLSPGEKFFEVLCQELKKAKKFIFMEYFIIQEGKMWDTILEILLEKVNEGVAVKMLYDDIGCINLLPTNYYKHLRKLGIETHVFNIFRPSIDVFMNYRDHRKITVIDGNVGFTGGNNLADEYINAITIHGHFKDTSIKLTGDAVWNLSIMFLQQWQYYASEEIDYEQYRPTLNKNEPFASDGFVQPFADSPFDNHLIGETTYMNLIQHANNYISITTPYLILDNEMVTALRTASLSGVNVKIITPHIGDHWYVHMVTKYNYSALINAGVEIYEYTPGFIHAKTIVVDDIAAVVGTQNFDYRSFYLHFECGALLYKNSEILKIRQDHIETIAKSQRISKEDCKTKNPFKRFTQMVLNLFAPLL